MERLRKITFVAWIALMFATVGMSLTGCNTAEGFGEDMEDAGQEIQEEVDE